MISSCRLPDCRLFSNTRSHRIHVLDPAEVASSGTLSYDETLQSFLPQSLQWQIFDGTALHGAFMRENAGAGPVGALFGIGKRWSFLH